MYTNVSLISKAGERHHAWCGHSHHSVESAAICRDRKGLLWAVAAITPSGYANLLPEDQQPRREDVDA